MYSSFTKNSRVKVVIAVSVVVLVSGCSGGSSDGSATADAFFDSGLVLELLDPSPTISGKFGASVVELSNGNIVVTNPGDSSVVPNGGAVHLYDGNSLSLIASIYGDNIDDEFGSGAVAALGNDNFVIFSPLDDVNMVRNAGSVVLVDGTSGLQIGPITAGDNTDDRLGSNVSSFTTLNGVLSNSNYVVASAHDNVAGLVDAGSFRLMDGDTGAQIGSTFSGDNIDDRFGASGSIRPLNNGNFVVGVSGDDVGGIMDAGSVFLIDGDTGLQLGSVFQGDNAEDFFGGKIWTLENGNYLVLASRDDAGGLVDAGSIHLFDGATGIRIGAAITGTLAGDQIGSGRVKSLSNGNVVIVSENVDVGGVDLAGEAILLDGDSGAVISTLLMGDSALDLIFPTIIELANGNFALETSSDDIGGVASAGSVRLFDSATGVQIGNAIEGESELDVLGNGGLVALPNSNYVIISSKYRVNGINNAGRITLVDGSTNVPIANSLEGDNDSDLVGAGGVAALANGNYVIGSSREDIDLNMDAGSIRLASGIDGSLIGDPIVGDSPGDGLGRFPRVASNNTFLVVSEVDDVNSVVDAGSARLVDGATGAVIKLITGNAQDDFLGSRVVSLENQDGFIFSAPNADNRGFFNSGAVGFIQ